MYNTFIKAFGGLALALIGTGIAAATPITSMPTLTAGGLTFTFGSNACVITGGSSPSSPSVCSQIDVATISDANIGKGLAITSGFSSTNGNFTDAKITYGLTSTYGINSIGVSFVGDLLNQGIVSISETAYSNGVQVGHVTASCASGVFGSSCTTASAPLILSGSYTNLTVVKDIFLNSAANNTAVASAVYQTFGDPKAVPEPMSMALLASGLMVVGFARLRNRKA